MLAVQLMPRLMRFCPYSKSTHLQVTNVVQHFAKEVQSTV